MLIAAFKEDAALDPHMKTIASDEVQQGKLVYP